MRARDAERLLFAGTYTNGRAGGIFALAFDEEASSLRIVHEGGRAPNPSFVTQHGRHLYAAHELDDRGCLAVYMIEDDGALVCRGACSSPEDAGTCFAAVHPDGRCLYGANYQSGSIGLCLLACDGNPCGGLPSVHHAGGGPNRARQGAPHVHSASFVPGANLLAVVDLGCDTVTLYRAEATGALETPPAEVVHVPDGSGPRMLAFHPHLPMAALVDELANDVLLFRFDRAGLNWERIGRLELPTVRSGAAKNGCAVLAAHPAFSPDGSRLYVSVRGSDRIALFDIDGSGSASARADYPSGGCGPRHISLSPAGDRLAVANQDSDEVILFDLAADGEPVEAARIAVPRPSCVVWER